MNLDVALGERGADTDWDAFVDEVRGGSHVQTARWADAKALLGWEATRVVVRRSGAIVGGCQLLLRSVGPATLAYAPRAPLARDVPGALEAVLDGVDELAGRSRLPYLKVQPPAGGETVGARLLARGYVASDLEAAPTASTLVDLTAEPEAILARMRSGTRANIRKAQRRGVTVREGALEEVDRFGELVLATSRRQGFRPYPAAYYRRILERFGADDRATLLLVEHDGELLSGLLILGWNDSAVYKMGAWRGDTGALRPNELGHWQAMLWARARGFRHYDFDGLPPDVARRVVAGQPLEQTHRGTAWFKLGFGGTTHVWPGAYDTSPSRMLGPMVRAAAPRLSRGRALAQRILGRD